MKGHIFWERCIHLFSYEFFLIFFRASIFLDFSDFEPRIILKLSLNTKGATSPRNFRNIFQSLLMFYYIIKLSKSLYFVSIMQRYI